MPNHELPEFKAEDEKTFKHHTTN